MNPVTVTSPSAGHTAHVIDSRSNPAIINDSPSVEADSCPSAPHPAANPRRQRIVDAVQSYFERVARRQRRGRR